MKIGLEIRNPKKAIRPSKNDVIIFDGKEWYVTTKEDILREFDERISQKEKELSDKIDECDRKISEINNLKIDVAKQLLEFGKIVTGLVSKEDK